MPRKRRLSWARTFGKLNVCAGGLNGAMKGPSCDDPARMDPPIPQSNMYPNCKPEAKIVDGEVVPEPHACWKSGNRTSRGSCGKFPCTYAPELHPVFPIYGRYYDSMKDRLESARYVMLDGDIDNNGADIAMGEGWTDGGIWDQTPEKFDNNYFQLLQGEQIGQKDICCGPYGRYKERKNNVAGVVCLDVGDERNAQCQPKWKNKSAGKFGSCVKKMFNITAREEATPSSDICSARWCRYGGRKGKDHMKSPTLWHEAGHSFVKKADKLGAYKRIVRLAGDWALLTPETKIHVDTFAADQTKFFDAFAAAFTKVMNRGYDSSTLLTCS